MFAWPNCSLHITFKNGFCEDRRVVGSENFCEHCYLYYFCCCFVTEEDGEAVPGGQEHAEGVPVTAGVWVLAGQAFC